MKFPLLINFKDFHLHINILFIVASEVKFQKLRLSKKTRPYTNWKIEKFAFEKSEIEKFKIWKVEKLKSTKLKMCIEKLKAFQLFNSLINWFDSLSTLAF